MTPAGALSKPRREQPCAGRQGRVVDKSAAWRVLRKRALVVKTNGPFWDRCTHFSLFQCGLGCSQQVRGFDRNRWLPKPLCPCGQVAHQGIRSAAKLVASAVSPCSLPVPCKAYHWFPECHTWQALPKHPNLVPSSLHNVLSLVWKLTANVARRSLMTGS